MPNKIALATKHGKFAQIGPAFETLTEWQIEIAEIDTDVFGTFSGEIERSLSPKATAIEKAKAGAEFLGYEFGMASEGTIGPHPQMPFVNADFEIIALVNIRKNFALVETFLTSEIQAHSEIVNAETDLDTLIRKLDLPIHSATVKVDVNGSQQFHKGICVPDALKHIISEALSLSPKSVQVENDFRAMHSPSRQLNINAVAQKLAARINSNCPNCNEIGWGKVGYEYGLPCSSCFKTVTTAPHAEKHGCVSCDFTSLVSLAQEFVDPSRCDFCNP